MKNRIEKMIVSALEKIKADYPGKEDHEIVIPKTFSGSISSLGASIGQMGLLPALAVYAAEQGGDEGKHREKILNLIAGVLAESAEEPGLNLQSITSGQGLFQRAVTAHDNANDFEALKDLIKDAAVALKLALRTFKRES